MTDGMKDIIELAMLICVIALASFLAAHGLLL